MKTIILVMFLISVIFVAGCTNMGRKTIGKGEVNLPNFIEYSDLNNLIELIVEEAKYIGKVREDVANSLKIQPVVIEPLTKTPPLGRFAVRDSGKTVAVGIVEKVEYGKY